jgi:hypothetical protein
MTPLAKNQVVRLREREYESDLEPANPNRGDGAESFETGSPENCP